jgi:hypothetical protein
MIWSPNITLLITNCCISQCYIVRKNKVWILCTLFTGTLKYNVCLQHSKYFRVISLYGTFVVYPRINLRKRIFLQYFNFLFLRITC